MKDTEKQGIYSVSKLEYMRFLMIDLVIWHKNYKEGG